MHMRAERVRVREYASNSEHVRPEDRERLFGKLVVLFSDSQAYIQAVSKKKNYLPKNRCILRDKIDIEVFVIFSF